MSHTTQHANDDDAGVQFLKTYGGVYEASPWVAEAVWPLVQSGAIAKENLAATMRDAVDDASRAQQLALIRTHPELAGRAAIGAEMTAASRGEQADAGLNECTREEFDAFQHLNAQYNERFGFPFIVAVKGLTRTDILKQFRARLGASPKEEFLTALGQIHTIAAFRLAEITADQGTEND